MTLYELTDDYMRLLDMMDDPDLDQQTLKYTMEGIEGAYEDKFDGYAAVIRQLTGYINELEEEKKRIDARKESFENNVKKMKKIMLESMNATGKTKFKTAKNSFWTQKNKASVVIDAKSVWDLPERFLRFRDPEVDKTKINGAIKAGEDLTGIAHLEQTESLRIR